MRHNSNGIKVEDFVKSELKNRQAMLKASKLIDEFRKRWGKAGKEFNSVKIIRKIRDSR